MTLLKRIEALVGPIRVFDGRYALWTQTSDCHDIRSVAARLDVGADDVTEALEGMTDKRRKR